MISLPGHALTNHEVTCWTLHDRLRCVRIAPFATPVVPPVYCSAAGSSMSIPTRGGFAGVVLISRRMKWTLGPVATDAMSGGFARRSRSGASRFSGKRR